MAKRTLSLLASASNIFDYPQATIDSYKIPAEDVTTIINSTKLFIVKAGEHFSQHLLKKHFDNDFKNFDFVSLPKYPLPAAFNPLSESVPAQINWALAS